MALALEECRSQGDIDPWIVSAMVKGEQIGRRLVDYPQILARLDSESK